MSDVAPIQELPNVVGESSNFDGSLPHVVPDEAPSEPTMSGAGATPLESNANRPSASQFAGLSSQGASLAADSAAPSMIGDFFTGGYRYSIFTGPTGNSATATPSGGDRRFKFSDNNSPLPQNRIFYNYNHFHNALVDINGDDQNVDRSTFGVEHIIGDTLTSWELRIPFLGTAQADQVQGVGDTTGVEFGNVAFALKRLIYRRPCLSVGAGLGVVIPTGSDSNFFDSSATEPTVTFANDALHLQPFIGAYMPRGRAFHQVFAQLDFDTNGNDVTFQGVTEVLQDQTLLYLDYSVGYWLLQNRCHNWVQGLAPMVELHYTTTLQDQDYGQFGGALFVVDPRTDALNITGGLFVQLSNNTSVKIGGVAPLRTISTDKLFDAEFGVQVVRRY